MTPQHKTIALFAVVAYVVSVPLSSVLFGMGAKAWLLLAALAPCAVAIGWVKILFLRPRLQNVSGLLRGGGVGLLSYLSFSILAAVYLSLYSYRPLSGLRELLWFALTAGTVMFGLPLALVGAVTGLVAEKRFRSLQ